MQTFAPARPMVSHPAFAQERARALAGLDLAAIDPPIRDLVEGFARLGHCFTMQCCWGHFVHPGQPDQHGVERLADFHDHTRVDYRLSYVAFCLQNSGPGRRLHDDLAGLVGLDPDNIQFGSADWFWQQAVNTYQVQVEPRRHQYKDHVEVGIAEGLRLQEVRGRFFAGLREILARHLADKL